MQRSLLERLKAAEKELDRACRGSVASGESTYETGYREEPCFVLHYKEASELQDIIGKAIDQIMRMP